MRGWGPRGGEGRAVLVRAAGAVVAALSGLGVLTGCDAGSGNDAPAPPTTSRPPGQVSSPATAHRTEEYLPGLDADVYEARDAGAGAGAGAGANATAGTSADPAVGPLVVLLPGGGWRSADRSGLAPLAAALADAGVTVVSATYRTAATRTSFPAPLEDVACAVAFAVARAAPAGGSARPLVVVGHSAGANLAALAALTPEHRAASCPYAAAEPDAFVGLAGPYDVSGLEGIAEPFFGVARSEDPDLWAEGNPLTYSDDRPDVAALLLHGSDDQVVPVRFTEDFAAALENGEHAVTAEIVDGADHSDIYRVDVVADRILTWIDALP